MFLIVNHNINNVYPDVTLMHYEAVFILNFWGITKMVFFFFLNSPFLAYQLIP